jgi:glycosyltransferase involved in cell wall biosynthesis
MKWQKQVHQPEKVTVTTIVHIPFLEGYWAESLEVLKLCLQSLRESTRVPFDLMVFDNASCVEVQDYLVEIRRLSKIQYLLISEHNLGKVGAWNILLPAAPGKIVSYTDSDVYFLPGWLEASVGILNGFPEAGMITAQPIPGDLSLHCDSTLKAALKDASVSIREGDDLIPDEYVKAHIIGLGLTRETFQRRIQKRKDVLLTRGPVSAYVSSSHFQFTATMRVLRSLFPMGPTLPLGDDAQFDDKIDAAGFWRLSTTEYLVHHMGNCLPSLQSELGWLNMGDLSSVRGIEPGSFRGKGFLRRLSRGSFVRRVMKRIIANTYKLLYEV